MTASAYRNDSRGDAMGPQEQNFERSSVFAHDLIAGSIAHEIRQPLTAIILSADVGVRCLDYSPPDLDRARAAFTRIIADGHRAGAMVEDIRANFKRGPSANHALDVNELIEGAIARQRSELEERLVFARVEMEEQLPRVRGNWSQLQQVLRNLISNAVDSMAVTSGSRVLRVKSAAFGAGHVMVSVADTGVGIDASAAERIFDPQFTTKADGMGMGLAICRAIVEAHDGDLWFAPNTPTGAIFSFTLQIVQSMASA
jgi:signal transduction histidine kinase